MLSGAKSSFKIKFLTMLTWCFSYYIMSKINMGLTEAKAEFLFNFLCGKTISNTTLKRVWRRTLTCFLYLSVATSSPSLSCSSHHLCRLFQIFPGLILSDIKPAKRMKFKTVCYLLVQLMHCRKMFKAEIPFSNVMTCEDDDKVCDICVLHIYIYIYIV